MPNRPPPPGPTKVTLQPGGAIAAQVGIDQTTPSGITPAANTVTLAPGSVLPVGAATDASLALLNALAATQNKSLASLDSKAAPLVSAKDPVDPRGLAVPVNVAVAPLPPHAATDTLQGAGNALLAALSANTPPLVAGRHPVDVPPVTIAASQLPAGASTETTLARMAIDGRRASEWACLAALDADAVALQTRGNERIGLLAQNRGGR